MGLLTLAWIGVCLVFSLVLRRRPHVVVSAVVVVAVAVPASVDVALLTGLSAAGYLIAAHAAVQTLVSPATVAAELRRYHVLWAGAILLAAYMVAAGWATGRSLVWLPMIAGEYVVLPFLFFVLVCTALRGEPTRVRTVVGTVAALVAAEVILSWLQNLRGEPLVWSEYFQAQRWWTETFVVEQPLGTFGHWIPLSVFLAASLPIVWHIRFLPLRIVLVLAIVATVVLSAARTGLVMVAIGLAVMIVRSLDLRRMAGAISAVVMLAALIGFGMNLASSSFAELLLDKLEDDGTSTQLRVEALDWFWGNTGRFVFGGLVGDTDLFANGTLNSSLENAFSFFAVEFGLVSTAALLAGFVAIGAIVLVTGGEMRWAAVAGIVGLVFSFNTFGSFAIGDPSGLLMLWLLAGLGVAAERADRAPRGEPDDDDAVERFSPAVAEEG